MKPLHAEQRAPLLPVSAPERPLDRWATVTKAIRQRCMDCSGGSTFAVRHCPIGDCSVWPRRMGVSPKTLRRRQPGLLDREVVLQMWAKSQKG